MPEFLKKMPSAVLTAMMAVFCGTVMDALVKYLSVDLDLLTIVFWRFALAAVFVAVPFFLTGRRLPGWQATRFHAFRGAIHVSAAYLFFFALGKLDLVEVTTLGFTAALLIPPVAWLILGERLNPLSFVAGLIGFVGVLITLNGGQFGTSLTPDRLTGFGAVMVSACLYAVSIVLLRKRAAQDGGFVIALYANVFPAIFIAPIAFIYGEPASLSDAPVLLFAAFFGMLIWVLMTSAYARAPAQRLAPVEYTALLWSALIGWYVFKEVPSVGLWIGAGFIIGACLIVTWQDARSNMLRGRASVTLPTKPLPED